MDVKEILLPHFCDKWHEPDYSCTDCKRAESVSTEIEDLITKANQEQLENIKKWADENLYFKSRNAVLDYLSTLGDKK